MRRIKQPCNGDSGESDSDSKRSPTTSLTEFTELSRRVRLLLTSLQRRVSLSSLSEIALQVRSLAMSRHRPLALRLTRAAHSHSRRPARTYSESPARRPGRTDSASVTPPPCPHWQSLTPPGGGLHLLTSAGPQSFVQACTHFKSRPAPDP